MSLQHAALQRLEEAAVAVAQHASKLIIANKNRNKKNKSPENTTGQIPLIDKEASDTQPIVLTI